MKQLTVLLKAVHGPVNERSRRKKSSLYFCLENTVVVGCNRCPSIQHSSKEQLWLSMPKHRRCPSSAHSSADIALLPTNHMKGRSEHWGVTGSSFVTACASLKGRQKTPEKKSRGQVQIPVGLEASLPASLLPSPPSWWSSSAHTEPGQGAELSKRLCSWPGSSLTAALGGSTPASARGEGRSKKAAVGERGTGSRTGRALV